MRSCRLRSGHVFAGSDLARDQTASPIEMRRVIAYQHVGVYSQLTLAAVRGTNKVRVARTMMLE